MANKIFVIPIKPRYMLDCLDAGAVMFTLIFCFKPCATTVVSCLSKPSHHRIWTVMWTKGRERKQNAIMQQLNCVEVTSFFFAYLLIYSIPRCPLLCSYCPWSSEVTLPRSGICDIEFSAVNYLFGIWYLICLQYQFQEIHFQSWQPFPFLGHCCKVTRVSASLSSLPRISWI